MKTDITSELKIGLSILFKNKYFYICLALFILSLLANSAAQTYLYSLQKEGHTLPVLSDLILDNIPYYNISWLYDALTIASFLLFLFYVCKNSKYDEVPFYLFIFSLFYFLRSIFIVLTPIGNPADFFGTNGPFKGFARYELGVYPSGHTGFAFLYFILSNGKIRILLGLIVLLVILSLFLSRGHYSIDILSGMLFAYAIYSFGKKHFKKR